jgi:hypothetical protein
MHDAHDVDLSTAAYWMVQVLAPLGQPAEFLCVFAALSERVGVDS